MTKKPCMLERGMVLQTSFEMNMTLFTPKPPPPPNNFFSTNHHQMIIANDTQISMETTPTTTTSNSHLHHNQSHTSTSRSSDSADRPTSVISTTTTTAPTDNKWASRLLKECAKALSEKDSSKIHHLLWMLNELASPYGDCDQKLASYFLQAFFCKATGSGRRCYKTLASVSEKSHSFDVARKLILKFQEASPWTTFGHVASNGAILEALDGEPKLHIIDISNTLCTQWPTLLESLATKNDDTPRLKLTVVVTPSIVRSVMKEVGQRMEKFARLMGVPFEFNVVSGLNNFTRESLRVEDDEAIAINCIGAFKRVEVEERTNMIKFFKSINPKVITIVEEEADFTSTKCDFVKCFDECFRYYALYFEMLEESFVPTSNERLMLERECSRSIVKVLACDDENGSVNGEELCERRERGIQWEKRMQDNSFSPIGFSDDVIDDVKSLIKRYKVGWAHLTPKSKEDDAQPDVDDEIKSHQQASSGIYLTWKDQPVTWASAWKP